MIALKHTLAKTLGLMALIALMLLTALLVIESRPRTASGSVSQGSSYHATTTRQILTQNDIQLASLNGTLGSVVITGGAAGVIELYDATTSDVTQRAAQYASSTILLATIPASAATGTYTFDELYFNGLYLHVVGTMPTSTITFRQ